MTTLRWPGRLPPRDVAADIIPRAILGPPSLSGGQQAVQSDAGCWYIQYGSISVIEEFRIKLWRVMAALLNVAGTPILLPVFDCKRAPWPLNASGHPITGYGATPHSDTSLFSDGTGYATRVIDIVIASIVTAGDTAINITVNNAAALEGGEFFSTDRGDMYVITSVTLLTGSTYTIGISPPARAPLAAAARLEFDNPVCRCVLETPGSMSLMLTQRTVGRPSLNFIEDFS